MEFKDDFSSRQAKFLSKNNTYNYYKIGVSLFSYQSIISLTKFIQWLKHYSCDLFYSLSIRSTEANYNVLQEFFKVYFEKGFDSEVIAISTDKFFNKNTFFADRIIINRFTSDLWTYDSWHALSLWNRSYFYKENLSKKIEDNNSWEKLWNLKFHTLEIDFDQIDSMIRTFGDFDESNPILPINSDSWVKLSIQNESTSYITTLKDSQ